LNHIFALILTLFLKNKSHHDIKYNQYMNQEKLFDVKTSKRYDAKTLIGENK